MDSQGNQKRTSIAQFTWVGKRIYAFLSAIFRHIERFRAGYSFLLGIVATLLTIVSIIWYGILAYPLPWKVIDPRDPRFDPLTFRITDYDSDSALFEALRKIFPVGTSKQYVDHVLNLVGGVKISKFQGEDHFIKNPEDRRYYYEYRNLRSTLIEAVFMLPAGEAGWKISIIFDKNEKLLTLNVI